jgi:cytochrome P450
MQVVSSCPDRATTFSPVLVAGFETTSTTLAWSLWHMARDLRAQRRAREEILAIFAELGVSSVAELSYEEIWSEKFTLVENIINETLRMHPPLASIERTAMRDVVVPTGNNNR